MSVDHDHVLADLRECFELVLDALESDGGWATNRILPGKVILANLDGVETGVRQLIRKTPLETERIEVPSGALLQVPTRDETLRIKAFLVVRRNMTRDYLDTAALADRAGIDAAAEVLAHIDDHYADQIGDGQGVASQVARQLADPRPADASATRQLDRYKHLSSRWTQWSAVIRVLADVAATMYLPEAGGQ